MMRTSDQEQVGRTTSNQVDPILDLIREMRQKCSLTHPMNEPLHRLEQQLLQLQTDPLSHRDGLRSTVIDNLLQQLFLCLQHTQPVELIQLALQVLHLFVRQDVLWSVPAGPDSNCQAIQVAEQIMLFLKLFVFDQSRVHLVDDRSVVADHQHFLAQALQIALELMTERADALPDSGWSLQLRMCLTVLDTVERPAEPLMAAVRSCAHQAIKGHVQRFQTSISRESLSPSQDTFTATYSTVLQLESLLGKLEALSAHGTASDVLMLDFVLGCCIDWFQLLPQDSVILQEPAIVRLIWSKMYSKLDELFTQFPLENGRKTSGRFVRSNGNASICGCRVALLDSEKIQRQLIRLSGQLHRLFADNVSIRPLLNSLHGKCVEFGRDHATFQKLLLKQVHDVFDNELILIRLSLFRFMGETDSTDRTQLRSPDLDLQAFNVRVHQCTDQLQDLVRRVESEEALTECDFLCLESLSSVCNTLNRLADGCSVFNESVESKKVTGLLDKCIAEQRPTATIPAMMTSSGSNLPSKWQDSLDDYKQRLHRLLRCSSSSDEAEAELNDEFDETDTSSESNQYDRIDSNDGERVAVFLHSQLSELLKTKLIRCKNVLHVDNALIKFSSDFCANLSQLRLDRFDTSDHLLVSADGIYATTVAALSLCFRQINRPFDLNDSSEYSRSTDRFVHAVVQSGNSVFIPSAVLIAMHSKCLRQNLFISTSSSPSSCSFTGKSALIRFLMDLMEADECLAEDLSQALAGKGWLHGDFMINLSRKNHHLLSDVQFMHVSFESEQAQIKSSNRHQRLLQHIVRCMLEELWPAIRPAMTRLFALLPTFRSNPLESVFHRQFECTACGRQCSFLTQLLATLCNLNCLFGQLHLSSFVDQALEIQVQTLGSLDAITITSFNSLSAFQLLCAQHLLATGLVTCATAGHGWSHVFKAIQLITAARRCCETIRSSSAVWTWNADIKRVPFASWINDRVARFRSLNSIAGDLTTENDDCVRCSAWRVLHKQIVSPNQYWFTKQSSNQESSELADKFSLTNEQYQSALNSLEDQIQRFFHLLASQLKVFALMPAIRALIRCSAGELCLVTLSSNHSSFDACNIAESLLLTRLHGLIQTLIRCGRPFLHPMLLWQLLEAHLIETVGHASFEVSKCGIITLNDSISAWLTCYAEPPHFRLHEWLFQCFERLLQLQVCPDMSRPLLLSCLCGFVETAANEIGSGWRSVFNALCTLRSFSVETSSPIADEPWSRQKVEMQRISQLRILIDTLEAYFTLCHAQPKVLVFTAKNCLKCLLQLLQSTDASALPLEMVADSEQLPVSLNFIALKYLHKLDCELRNFHGNAIVYKLSQSPRIVWPSRPLLPNDCDLKSLQPWIRCSANRSTCSIQDTSGLKYVWLCMIDGLLNCARVTSFTSVQDKCVQLALAILGTLRPESVGDAFIAFVIRHSLYTCLLDWPQFESPVDPTTDGRSLANFKHLASITSHLTIQFVRRAYLKSFEMIDVNNNVIRHTRDNSDSLDSLISTSGLSSDHPDLFEHLLYSLLCYAQMVVDNTTCHPLSIGTTCFACIQHTHIESIRMILEHEFSDDDENRSNDDQSIEAYHSNGIAAILTFSITRLTEAITRTMQHVLGDCDALCEPSFLLLQQEPKALELSSAQTLLISLFPTLDSKTWAQIDVDSLLAKFTLPIADRSRSNFPNCNISLGSFVHQINLCRLLIQLFDEANELCRQSASFAHISSQTTQWSQTLICNYIQNMIALHDTIRTFNSCSSFNQLMQRMLATPCPVQTYALETQCLMQLNCCLTLNHDINLVEHAFRDNQILDSNDYIQFWCQSAIRLWCFCFDNPFDLLYFNCIRQSFECFMQFCDETFMSEVGQEDSQLDHWPLESQPTPQNDCELFQTIESSKFRCGQGQLQRLHEHLVQTLPLFAQCCAFSAGHLKQMTTAQLLVRDFALIRNELNMHSSVQVVSEVQDEQHTEDGNISVQAYIHMYDQLLGALSETVLQHGPRILLQLSSQTLESYIQVILQSLCLLSFLHDPDQINVSKCLFKFATLLQRRCA